jgi:hypothetical protein
VNHVALIGTRDAGSSRISLRVLQLTALGAIVTASYLLGVHRTAPSNGGTAPGNGGPDHPSMVTERSKSLPPASSTQAAGAVSPTRIVSPPRAAPPEPDAAGEGPSALAHRDRVVAALQSSGPAQPGLDQAAGTVLASWIAKVAELGVAGDFGSMECHAKGCFVTATYPREQAASQATDVITRTSEFNGWQAGKMRSGVIPRSDGTVEVTWVLDAPPPNRSALAAPLPPDSLEELRHAWAHTRN